MSPSCLRHAHDRLFNSLAHAPVALDLRGDAQVNGMEDSRRTPGAPTLRTNRRSPYQQLGFSIDADGGVET